MQIIKSRSLFLLLISMCALLLAACSSDDGLTVRELRETREAAIAEAEIAATTEATERLDALVARAPEGTVFAETEPGRNHDSSISIPFGPLPPNGGTHNPSWQRCQVYDQPVKPEHAVHSMEHSGVWITYQPDLDSASVSELERVARGEPFVLMSPYPNLRSPVVVTAWGIQLEVDSASDARIQQFVDSYAGGSQSPEPGASCRTGVQDTVDG